jgi:hypothetical protein
MTSTREMLQATGAAGTFGEDELAAAIDACADCVQSCTGCADASLAEDDVATMAECITRCTTCADVCSLTLRLLSRRVREDRFLIVRQLQACVRTCDRSAAECERHAAHHVHCAVCARVCRVCAQACRQLLDDEALAELQAIAGG